MNENEEGSLKGTFVETAFTADEIERAITEEKKRCIQNTPCAFVGDIADSK